MSSNLSNVGLPENFYEDPAPKRLWGTCLTASPSQKVLGITSESLERKARGTW